MVSLSKEVGAEQFGHDFWEDYSVHLSEASFLQGFRATLQRCITVVSACMVVAGFTPARAGGASSYSETVVYSFKGGSDGVSPQAGLILDKNGTLYGTTSGDDSTFGTVFRLVPPASGTGAWTETALYSFQGGSDGVKPLAGVIVDTYGALYGTTTYGGRGAGCGSTGCGTVFRLAPPPPGAGPWTETVLYSFQGGNDGINPQAGVILDTYGALYGTTTYGGTGTGRCGGESGCGTVFKLTPPVPPAAQWIETVLYSFQGGSDGSAPQAGLIFDTSGALYGTTQSGGSAGYGTVFKLTPPAPPATQWTETALYSFQGGSDGAYPYGGVIFDTSGALYGATAIGGTGTNCASTGCGTVFRLVPPASGTGAWTETVLYSFQGGNDGESPLAGVTFDTSGALYGTTRSGGSSGGSNGIYGNGMVFKLTRPSSTPHFVSQTPWTETVLYNFQGGNDGAFPYGGVTFDSRGALYGTTGGGGSSNFGTVIKLQCTVPRGEIIGGTPHWLPCGQ